MDNPLLIFEVILNALSYGLNWLMWLFQVYMPEQGVLGVALMYCIVMLSFIVILYWQNREKT